jgi:aminoglycoside phosphotransferase (APT) family kinase protein
MIIKLYGGIMMKLNALGKPIATGNTAHIYHCEQGIVKLFHDYLPANVASYEGNKQQLVYNKGVNVPEVLDITTIEGRPALLMRYVEGRPIGELILASLPHHPQQAEFYIHRFVEAQLGLHQLDGEPLETMEQKLSQQLHRAELLHNDERAVLLEQLSRMQYRKVICHGDLHPYNMLFSNNEVTIIDWVDATAGDMRADVYRTYLLIAPHSSTLAEQYIALYCDKSGVKREEIFQWAAIIAAARLSEHNLAEEKARLLAIVKKRLKN